MHNKLIRKNSPKTIAARRILQGFASEGLSIVITSSAHVSKRVIEKSLLKRLCLFFATANARSSCAIQSAHRHPVSCFTRQPSCCWRQTTRADVIITAMTMAPPSENKQQGNYTYARLQINALVKCNESKNIEYWFYYWYFVAARHVHKLHCSDARAQLQRCTCTRVCTLLTLTDGGRVITIIITWKVQNNSNYDNNVNWIHW